MQHLPSIEELLEELRKVSKEALKQKAYERLAQLRIHPEENAELIAELEELNGEDERWYDWVSKAERTDEELWMGIVVHCERQRRRHIEG
jgi:hypothetical protein